MNSKKRGRVILRWSLLIVCGVVLVLASIIGVWLCRLDWEKEFSESVVTHDFLAARLLLLLDSDLLDTPSSGFSGRAPLFWAAWEDAQESAAFLLGQGADVNWRDYDGKTPLHAAALNGNEEVVRMLLRYGADLNAKDNEGKTPLTCAREESMASRGKSSRAIAAREGKENIVEFLKNQGGKE
jgi:hypothetical protein